MVVLLLFMVPEGFFLVSVAANYSGDGRVTLLHQGWKQASKKIQVPILSCTICDRGHRNNCCQEVLNALAGIPDQEGMFFGKGLERGLAEEVQCRITHRYHRGRTRQPINNRKLTNDGIPAKERKNALGA